MTSGNTFVTCLIDLKENRDKDKSFDRYLELFTELISPEVGLNVVAFVSSTFLNRLGHINNPKVIFIPCELEQTDTYKEIYGKQEVSLPAVRTEEHDTKAFLTLMNCKTEFIKKAMDMSPFNSSHYIWIDAGIIHVFKKNKKETLGILTSIQNGQLKDKVLVSPGCWGGKMMDKNYIFNRVCWRFCGGFFAGDRESLYRFADVCSETIKELTQLTWEVNIWSYIESFKDFKIDWYSADHNDTIVQIPSSYFNQRT